MLVAYLVHCWFKLLTRLRKVVSFFCMAAFSVFAAEGPIATIVSLSASMYARHEHSGYRPNKFFSSENEGISQINHVSRRLNTTAINVASVSKKLTNY